MSAGPPGTIFWRPGCVFLRGLPKAAEARKGPTMSRVHNARVLVNILTSSFLVLLFAAPVLASEKLFTASSYGNEVEVFDVVDPAEAEAAIGVGVYPRQVVASPTGDAVYTANYETGDISVVDPVSQTVIETISLPCRPSTLAVSANGNAAYAVCRKDGQVVHVDLGSGTAVGQIPVTYPYDLALDAQGRFAYVTRLFFSRYLYVVDLQSQQVVATVVVGRSPKGVAIAPSGEYVYVADSGSGSISIVSTATRQLVGSIPVAAGPTTMTIDASGQFLYVTHSGGGSVSIVDLNTESVVSNVGVGIAPETLALSGDGSRLYVANYRSNTISVVDTAEHMIVGDIATGGGPYGVVLLEDVAVSQSDTTPPELGLSVNNDTLWPPNHKLRDISVGVIASDDLDVAPQVTLVSISSSDPCDENSASANAAPQSCEDIVGAEVGTYDVDFQLRAERSASSGVERVYTVTYEASDAAGNTTTKSIDIVVPLHN